MPRKPSDKKPRTQQGKTVKVASSKARSRKAPLKKDSQKLVRKPVRSRGRASANKRKAKKRVFLSYLIPPKRVWVILTLIFMVACAFWVFLLDVQVVAKFSGKKWAIPARVYARPLEIYEGLALKTSELERELRSLGYRPVKKVWQPGQFSRVNGRYHIYTRDFIFPSQVESAARYEVTIDNNTVVDLQGADDDLVLRIEPKEIGSIYPSHGEDRILMRLQDVPPLLAESLMAVEDKDFAHHHGISIKGISRAMLANLKAMRFIQGGSTLTQQLVKNFYLTQERHLWRKMQEAIMSLLLELHYSKAEILEAYINEVYLGQSGSRAIHGFGLASRHYFNRPLNDLSPHQVALLVAMVKGASYYNPWRYPERVKQRRNVVLMLMTENQLISEAERQKYVTESLGVVDKAQLRLGDYPAFLDLVKSQLKRDYDQDDLQSDGLRIFTTMSPNVQELTESVIRRRLKKMKPSKGGERLQAAAIITAVGSGEVLAVAGDRNPHYQGFNRALDMRRSIGSLVKPFVYLTALADPNRYTLMSLLEDAPVAITLPNGDQWRPKNFDKQVYGNVPLYEALAKSYNLSTVNMGMSVGLASVVNTLQASGLTFSPPLLPSLLLGSLELSPLEVSHIYHTLAADGVYTPLRAIRSVLDAHNQPLQRYPLQSEPRIPAELSYVMHYGLQGVMRTGTGRKAYQQLPSDLIVAGKTGTTNRQRDSWFAGYSANHLGVVWLGNDNNTPTRYTGSSGALPIWSEIIGGISTESIANTQPENVEYYWVDQRSGLLSVENCDGAVLVPFIAGSQPVEVVDCEWTEGPINRWFKKWFEG